MPIGVGAGPDTGVSQAAWETAVRMQKMTQEQKNNATPHEQRYFTALDDAYKQGRENKFWWIAENAVDDAGYDSADSADHAEKFGGGQDLIHESQKENRHNAENEFKDKSQVLEFTRVLRAGDLPAQQEAFRQLQERDQAFKAVTFEQFCDSSYQILQNDETISRIVNHFPNLDPREVMDWVVSDGRFVAQLSESLIKAKRSTEGLPTATAPIVDDEKKVEQKKAAQDKLNERLDYLIVELNKAGIKISDTEFTRESLATIIGNVNSLDQLEKALARTPIMNIPEETFDDFKKLEGVKKRMEVLKAKGTKTTAEKQELFFLNIEANHLTKKPSISQNKNKYDNLQRLITGEFRKNAIEAIKLDGDIQHDRFLVGGDLAEDMKTRLGKEADILYELKNAIGQSANTLMGERYAKYLEAEKKVHAQENDENIRNIDKAIETNWVAYDSVRRRKLIHGDRIVDDLRILSVARDQGTLLLMARDLNIVTNNQLEPLLKKGSNQDTPEKQQEYINSLLKQISESPNKESLQKILEKKGAEYRRKLMSSTFIMREYLGEGILGHKIRLKDKVDFDGKRNLLSYLKGEMDANSQEWFKLCERYGGDVDESLNNNKTAANTLRKLKEKGIIPDSKLKYLLWFLIIILGIGSGGLIPAVGGLGLGAEALGGIAGGLGAKAAAKKFVQ